jgi:hypothetical protein
MLNKTFLSLTCVSLYFVSPVAAEENTEALKVHSSELKEDLGQCWKDLKACTSDMKEAAKAYLFNASDAFKAHLGELKESAKAYLSSANESIKAHARDLEESVKTDKMVPQWFIGLADRRDGEFIQTQDGAQWQINPADFYKLEYWMAGDDIEIVLNDGVFATKDYDYYITNLRRGSSIAVNLFAIPETKEPCTYTIEVLDKGCAKVWLSDGTCWDVTLGSLPVIGKWEENDRVLIAKKTSWLSWEPVFLNIDRNQRAVVHKLVATNP